MDCSFCLVFPTLAILRKISNHFELLKTSRMDDGYQAKRERQIAKFVLGEDAKELGGVVQQHGFLNVSDTAHCGKLAALEQLLEQWHDQHDKVHPQVFLARLAVFSIQAYNVTPIILLTCSEYI